MPPLNPRPQSCCRLKRWLCGEVQIWWAQRLSAVALVPLSLWFVSHLLWLVHHDLGDARAWVRTTSGAMGLSFFLIFCIFHSALGLRVIFQDYIHSATLRRLACWVSFGLLTGAGAVGLIALAQQVFLHG